MLLIFVWGIKIIDRCLMCYLWLRSICWLLEGFCVVLVLLCLYLLRYFLFKVKVYLSVIRYLFYKEVRAKNMNEDNGW